MKGNCTFKDTDGDRIFIEKPNYLYDNSILVGAQRDVDGGYAYDGNIYVLLTPKKARKLAKVLVKYAAILDPEATDEP